MVKTWRLHFDFNVFSNEDFSMQADIEKMERIYFKMKIWLVTEYFPMKKL
ncbi:MAG: hypothetical protein LBP83_02515 [Dysgonamonadaceae bacterium]|jgi:hypothetical protein|nr:hypothetical protein [Dysgonamonadaceae bacterium]